MNASGERMDGRQAPSTADDKPGRAVKSGQSGEGARSALEQLILQERARKLARISEERPALPGNPPS